VNYADNFDGDLFSDIHSDSDLELSYRKPRCVDRTHVLSDEVSSRVEELLIISTVEAIAVHADRI
jgi:hypothetical protein